MEKTKKFIKNFIIFILLIALTFYVALKDQDFSMLASTFKSANIKFLIVGSVLINLFFFKCFI